MDIYQFWKQKEKHELSLKKKGLAQLREARHRLERYTTERGGHEKERERLLHSMKARMGNRKKPHLHDN